MIRYIQHRELDLRKWDECITNSLNGTIYACSWYLNVACEKWDDLVEDDYDCVMPLPFRKKMGFSYIFPPSMTQQLGVFSSKIITENKVQEFIKSIPSKFKYCEINLNHGNPILTKEINITPRINLELNLSLPFAELYPAFSENTRRNIRKASALDLRIDKNDDISNLIQLFRESKGSEIKTLPGDFYSVVEKVSKQLLQRHQAQIWEIFMNNKLCAGVMFAFNRNRAYFLFSAANIKAKENGLMHFLISSFIEENAGKDIILDFEGSDNKNLARFYKSFGAVEKNYVKIIVNRLPDILFSMAQTIRKK